MKLTGAENKTDFLAPTGGCLKRPKLLLRIFFRRTLRVFLAPGIKHLKEVRVEFTFPATLVPELELRHFQLECCGFFDVPVTFLYEVIRTSVEASSHATALSFVFSGRLSTMLIPIHLRDP
jgi:hypothetical protein